MQKPLAQMTCKESSFIFYYERWIAVFMTCRDFQNDFMCYLFIFLYFMMIPSLSPASLLLSLYTHSHCVDGGLKVIFSQTPYSWVGSVCEPSSSLFPTALLLPSTPWSFRIWMKCFILFSLHSWEKNVDMCLPVWPISHLMSSSSIPCLQWILFYFSFGLHNTLLYVPGSIKIVSLHMGYIICLYPFICWWTCRLTPHPKCCGEHTYAGILVHVHTISLSPYAGVGKRDWTKALLSALQWC